MGKNARRYILYVLCITMIAVFETGCRAKSCPAYGDEPPKKGIFKKNKKKTKNGVFNRRQRRYF
jgi:hypothetical protein